MSSDRGRLPAPAPSRYVDLAGAVTRDQAVQLPVLRWVLACFVFAVLFVASNGASAGTLTLDGPPSLTVSKLGGYEWRCGNVASDGERTGATPTAACTPAAIYEQTRPASVGVDAKTWVYTFDYCEAIPSSWVYPDTVVCRGRVRETTTYTDGTSSVYNAGTTVIARPFPANSCPANSVVTGTSCTCTGGYVANSDATACLPPCTAGVVASSGYYEIGTTPGANPPIIGCRNGCMASFNGISPAGNSVENGTKVWYAKGKYLNNGERCTEAAAADPTKSIPAAQDTMKPPTCGANQVRGEVNGKAVCVDQAGELKDPTEGTKEKATTKTEKSSVTNPDGSTTTTETTTKTDGNGHKEVTTIKTTSRPDGTVTVDTDTSGTKSPATPGTGAGTEDGEEDPKDECEKHPSSGGCGGEPAAVTSLYTPKDKTMGGVLSAARDTFMSSPFGSSVSTFFVVSGGGTCPTTTAHIPFIDAELAFDQFCSGFATNALLALKAVLLLVASFFAFRIAVE